MTVNHHGGAVGIADEGFLHAPPSNKESPLLPHKELGLDDQERHPTVVTPSPATRVLSNNNSTPTLQKSAVLQSTGGSSEVPEKKQGVCTCYCGTHMLYFSKIISTKLFSIHYIHTYIHVCMRVCTYVYTHVCTVCYMCVCLP